MRDLTIEVHRLGSAVTAIQPAQFEDFDFQPGDRLEISPPHLAAQLPTTWGDRNIEIEPGRSIRVPTQWGQFEFKGFRIPTHLIALTGAGPETWDWIGAAHIRNYERQMGLFPEMHFVDIGCGIGRDAFQLMDYLAPTGRYLGVDVTRDSIAWCQRHLTARDARFTFHHFDAMNELYNPFGRQKTSDFHLPVADGSVDRIGLASVFTHLLEDEVLHYMREFRRVLKPSGLVHASFFLYSQAALDAAQTLGTTAWKATFAIRQSDGVYSNDPTYPRGAVAYTDATLQRLMREAGLCSDRPYVKGAWSGLHGDAAEEGQDAVILRRA
jgi:SAM-dependent methyltransferase